MSETLLDNDLVKIQFENNILIGTFKSETVDLELCKHITKTRLEVQNGRSYPLLSNIQAIKTISKPARDFMASEEGCEGVIAAAVLIGSPLGSMIGNFFISISRPLRPTKIFTDETEAKNWLSQFAQKS